MVNPFKYHGISSINIPIFINRSVFSQVAATFTKDIVMVLEGHRGLDVIGSDSLNESDAVLIGIVESDESLREAKSTSTSVFITGDLENSIGARQPFYIPAETLVKLKLRLILIKKPSKQQVELLTSAYSAKFRSPQIIFDETFILQQKVNRFSAGSATTDEAGIVNHTKNQGLVAKSLRALSKQSALQFKELIINAF